MAATKGKRVAIWAGAAAIVVVGATTFALKDHILEEWWLYKLEHGEEAQRDVAVEQLGIIGSTRSVGALLSAVDWKAWCLCVAVDRGAVFVDVTRKAGENWRRGYRVAEALRGAPVTGQVALIGHAVSDDPNVVLGAEVVLRAIHTGEVDDPTDALDEAERAAPPGVERLRLLFLAFEDDVERSPQVRRAAAEALTHIQVEKHAALPR